MNKKKKELTKLQKTLAIIGLVLCTVGAIFGFSQSMRVSVFFPPMSAPVRYILATAFVAYIYVCYYFGLDQNFKKRSLPVKVLLTIGLMISLMVVIGVLATVLYEVAVLPTDNEVPYAILSSVIVIAAGVIYCAKQKNQSLQ